MCADVTVRDAACHPHDSLLLALPYQFHNPRFLGVCDGEGLAFGRVSVGIGQFHYALNRLSSGAGSLKGDVDERAVVHYAVGVHLAFPAAPGSLRDDELMLVHIAHSLVGAFCLGDAAKRPAGVPFVDLEHSARLEAGCLVEVQFSVEPMRIRSIGDDVRSVAAGAFRDDYISASFTVYGK